MTLSLDGGSGDDLIDAEIRLRGTGRFVDARVLGSSSTDSLRLSLDMSTPVSRAFNALIDGAGGGDVCTAVGPVQMKRC